MFLCILLPDDGLWTRPNYVALFNFTIKMLLYLVGENTKYFFEMRQHDGMFFFFFYQDFVLVITANV
jgi:hypothetical protein